MKAPLPGFGHVPMILGTDGERLSKRHGATSVMDYKKLGFLPEALDNYLARLGWSHGDDEIFSMRQFRQWFDLGHVSSSPARFDPEKLKWLNQQHLKGADTQRLVPLAKEFLPKDLAGPPLERVIDVVKDRAATVRQLADEAAIFYARDIPKEAVAGPTRDALLDLRGRLEKVSWERGAISAAIKETLAATKMKMPQLAMPLRQVLTGRTQTPSIDAVLELLGRDTVLQRLKGI
jgi:glutamyl-tRNA synthetase